MGVEIERKFLVKGEYKKYANYSVKIIQGYLCSIPERSVRVRIKGENGYLTVKGIGNDSGTSRYEWEKEIEFEDAHDLLKICEPGVIDKTRFVIKAGKHEFEVDEFYGENEGLIIAEVELDSEDEYFEKPDWVGEEVTGIDKYYNVMLMKNPYSNW